ncbi:TPA: TetR family transcriptional regulator [Bacillus toyonensis]|nr:TetR family transcriptional regulator [Bacillus toyonensis]
MGRSINLNKEYVLNKAMYLFWEKGYDATSISDLFNKVT